MRVTGYVDVRAGVVVESNILRVRQSTPHGRAARHLAAADLQDAEARLVARFDHTVGESRVGGQAGWTWHITRQIGLVQARSGRRKHEAYNSPADPTHRRCQSHYPTP
ncbi:MAG: hypothetical protein ACK56I_29465, partial [bacterium]